MKKVLPRVTLILFIFLTGCASTTSFQTARSLEPGKRRLMIGLGYYTGSALSKPVVAPPSNPLVEEQTIETPMIEVHYRRGLFKDFEMGFRYTIPGQIYSDIKYQLFTGDRSILSVGLGAGYSGVALNQVDKRFTDLVIPLYGSTDVRPTITVYAVPKLFLRWVAGHNADPLKILGVSTGVRLGGASGVFLEITYMRDVNSAFTSLQMATALYFQ